MHIIKLESIIWPKSKHPTNPKYSNNTNIPTIQIFLLHLAIDLQNVGWECWITVHHFPTYLPARWHPFKRWSGFGVEPKEVQEYWTAGHVCKICLPKLWLVFCVGAIGQLSTVGTGTCTYSRLSSATLPSDEKENCNVEWSWGIQCTMQFICCVLLDHGWATGHSL